MPTTARPPSKRAGIKAADWKAKLGGVEVKKDDLNRLVMDYLCVEGYRDAAENFASESGLAPHVDLESVHHRMLIRDAVHSGDIVQAMERTNDLNPEILDKNPQLYFHLQQQKLIEMIRDGDIIDALAFAQSELAPRGEEHPEFLIELERTMTLFAFHVPSYLAQRNKDPNAPTVMPSKPQPKPKSANAKAAAALDLVSLIPPHITQLLEFSQRTKVAAELNSAILTAQSQPATPKLPNLLRMLAWGEQILAERCDFPHLDAKALASEPPKTETKMEEDSDDDDAMSVEA